MRKILLPLLVLSVSFVSCARKEVTRPPLPPAPSKRIALPRDKTGAYPAPYEVGGKRYYPLPESIGFVQYGKASWYGDGFHGRLTSSGEPFDMHKKSAAHKTLPLGSLVKVTNLENGKHTIVRINDRGPFVKDRIIDLSYAAAKEIDLVDKGVAEVKIVALAEEVGEQGEKGTSPPVVKVGNFGRGKFTVQVGAFENERNALELARRLKVLYDYVRVIVHRARNGKNYYKVWVSQCGTLERARRIEKELEETGFTGAFIVRI
ncbi:MAG: septal ring lytic transglycosylase RlpA family protein [Deltaproteobacteria bacterium]|nr:septal ring lytic transglycosylase RlpA family protein [Deltaproteobacteria bacterium]